ncbi:hypothetical protein HPB49_004241 [Dermacentor silvarum]|uniref:Uncharacterized protein n=1 Tax=Dermacentor silvarum TaxID=543639 RepID=A0ACB8CPP0_DERSI|nr:hypothetical protein HPB49_004241 [Dermacentor silvarum]
MNMQRAVQVFSPPVTAAMKLLQEQAGHTCDASFAGVGPTVQFMDTVHRWFVLMDVSNCTQHIHQKNADCMQLESAGDERLIWLETSFLDYLADLKNPRTSFNLSTVYTGCDNCFILRHNYIDGGNVNHSQRLGDGPLKVWVLCMADGSVLTAHCTCMAGVGEACSHIGACLFAVDTGVRMRNEKTCTGKDNAWLPTYVEKVQFKRLKDIDFTSSRGKKQLLDGSRADVQKKKLRMDIPPPSPEELHKLYMGIKEARTVPAIFSILPGYCEAFKKPEPKHKVDLRCLYSEDNAACTYEALVQKSENFVSAYVMSDDTVKRVEASTRQQNHSQQWFLYRAGRVTASVMKRLLVFAPGSVKGLVERETLRFQSLEAHRGAGCSYWAPGNAVTHKNTCCQFVYDLLCDTSYKYEGYSDMCE